jgi:hypothetical protein
MPDVGNRKRVPDKPQRRPIAFALANLGRAPGWYSARPRGFKGVAPLANLGVLRCVLRTPAGVQGGRPPCE